jgi:lipid kinase YegS
LTRPFQGDYEFLTPATFPRKVPSWFTDRRSEMRTLRMVLNGKAAGDPRLRDAVAQIRGAGHCLEVRVTWEAGDAHRFAAEACDQEIDVVVAAGGDGTVNETVNGMMRAEAHPSSALAVLPLGTANDFATGCRIPPEPTAALLLAATGPAVSIDLVTVNGSYFINVASGGFGARITATTPPELKRRFGGAAYALMGFRSLLESPGGARISVRFPDETITGSFLLGTIGNGRQAGGGFQVAPEALLDDGLLDVLLLRALDLRDADKVIDELREPTNPANRYTVHRRVPWLEVGEPEGGQRFLNLDGEPYSGPASAIRFEVLKRRLPVILPPAAAPLLQQARA